MRVICIFGLLSFATMTAQASAQQDVLVKLTSEYQFQAESFATSVTEHGGKAENLGNSWIRVQVPVKRSASILAALNADPAVEFVQPNYKIKLLESYDIQDPLRKAAIMRLLAKENASPTVMPDNLPIPAAPQQGTGSDPLISSQWGMNDIGAKAAWAQTMGSPEMVVAVIDTGIDYTHEDLLPNLWRNAKEIPNNNIDDDGNGYVDDIIGWDFSANDNKPYDLGTTVAAELINGGNPGHGTHCAGNVAARGNNGMGIAGVAPNVKIMGLRFISEKGSGTTADAIKAIKYAVDNGAKVLSNSWGSEGEDPAEGAENKALRDIITYAQDHDVLFIAAAGNGHGGRGYDNDSDKAPAYPASYDNENIISVAALNSANNLGGFSNWGARTVDIGAPGVDVFSTVIGDKKYNNKVIDTVYYEATWDGTSMATPHVAGAAALYLSKYPNKTWREVKEAILSSAKKIPSMTGKSVSGGKLDVQALMK